MTIDIALWRMETPKNEFTIIDAPGHRDFIKNMITGASQADAAVLMVGAQEGEFEAGFAPYGQTREHALLAYTMGVKQIVCCVTKMDLVNYSEERFNNIQKDVSTYLKQLGYDTEKVPFIPISGWTGDNLCKQSEKMPWYKGKSLLDNLDELKQPKRQSELPLRLCIQDCYEIPDVGTVACGMIDTGVLRPGMKLQFGPVGIQAEVKSIEIHHKPLNEGLPGMNVGFCIKGVKASDIHRGMVASDSNNDPC